MLSMTSWARKQPGRSIPRPTQSGSLAAPRGYAVLSFAAVQLAPAGAGVRRDIEWRRKIRRALPSNPFPQRSNRAPLV
jgi:hypothetical protein